MTIATRNAIRGIPPVIGSSPIGYTILEKSELQFATFGLLELFLGSIYHYLERQQTKNSPFLGSFKSFAYFAKNLSL